MNKDIKYDWSTLPIGKFMEINAIAQCNLTEDIKTLQVAAVLHNITYKQILDKSLDETQSMVSDTAFLYQQPKKVKLKKEYTLGDTTYKVIRNMNDITTAQYIDFQSIVGESNERLPEFLSIFFIPKGHKYNDGYDTEKTVSDIEQYLSVEEALSLSSFFIEQYSKSMKRTLLYLQVALKAMRWKSRKNPELKEMIQKTEQSIKALKEEIASSYGFHW